MSPQSQHHDTVLVRDSKARVGKHRLGSIQTRGDESRSQGILRERLKGADDV